MYNVYHLVFRCKVSIVRINRWSFYSGSIYHFFLKLHKHVFLNCWLIVDSVQYRRYLDLPSLMVGKFYKPPSIHRGLIGPARASIGIQLLLNMQLSIQHLFKVLLNYSTNPMCCGLYEIVLVFFNTIFNISVSLTVLLKHNLFLPRVSFHPSHPF